MNNNYILTSDGELYHYGVKGMKWGQRKANKLNAKALRARKHGKVDEAKVYEARAKERLAEGKRAEKFNQNYKEVRRKRSGGAKVALFLLGGPFANRTYSAVQASGGSKAKAVGVTAAATILGGPLGHLVASSIVKNNAATGTD